MNDDEILSEEEIVKLLSNLTSDFSSETIQFVMDLSYPLNVKIEYDNEGEESIISREVEDKADLKKTLKTLPESCTVVIEQDHASMVVEREMR